MTSIGDDALADSLQRALGDGYRVAGRGADALYQLRKFVAAYDQPQAAQRGLVDDAKQRIAKLEVPDAAPNSKVPPPR